MRIQYEGRTVEITAYEVYDGTYLTLSANYIDGDMRDLTEAEMIDLDDNYFESIYTVLPKGTGY